ncbi:MAG: RHS repeat domain-containing protein [Cellulophaga sp.]
MKIFKNISILFMLFLLFGVNAQTVTDTDKNLVYTATFDVTGAKKSASVSYFDLLGKATQSQNWDLKTNKIWTSQLFYDYQGRPALSTLSSPIGTGDFKFKANFVQKSNGVPYTTSDFETVPEGPSVVGKQSGTLGWYYSNSNTTEKFQDATNYPFSRTIYSKLNPGSVLKTIGGNKVDGKWPQAYTFSMSASNELSQSVAFGESKYNNYKIVKTVARDVHGVENVVFTNTDGQTLASARSGGATSRNMSVKIKEQGFVDIHVPAGSGMGFTVNTGGNTITVYNLITETKVTASSNLPNGFYRVSVNTPENYTPNTVTVNYKENYYDYSLNEYDAVGRLIKTYQPLGTSKNSKLNTEYKYNTLGQLVYTKNPDEGEAWFKYRADGQIRFSQNSKQKLVNDVSYTNYDGLARSIESGIFSYSNFLSAALNPDTTVPSGTKKELQLTTYDAITATDINSLPAGYKSPSFLAGNVAKTSNVNTTTYYSYDVYGRVKWVVQNINGLGVKTIDYEYDPVTSQVKRVIYQKNKADQFIHRYTYHSKDNNIVKVETSTNGTNYTTHAEYTYYETGALKRTALAGGIQGVDYVYNLNGQLKSINHPSLSAAGDPGGDANDLFGMNIHYNKNDYNRTNTPKPVPTITNGLDQVNGNIKAITWNTQNLGNNTPDTYYYKYNRNNWLEGASFNQNINGSGSYEPIEERSAVVTSTENVIAEQSIKLTNGFSIKATSTLSFSAKINNNKEVNGGGDYNVSNLKYDANGNIKSLKRNKKTASGSNAMDNLTYAYKTDKPNQLLRVDDAAGDVAGADDIGDQNGTNYEYNSIGQLISNATEGITYEYNTSGLVTTIKKNNIPLVMFFYNDKGFRVKKTSHNSTNGAVVFTEHYVRDASGTALAIYRNGQAVENTVYGSGRHGVYNRLDGSTSYQLTDHLGNVRAVFKSGSATAIAATDYYPFGMPMPGRNMVGDYRYAYQGQEKDLETGKEAFQLRLWDARIGRWLTTDPYGQFNSPYLGMGNNPMNGIDPDGGLFGKIRALFYKFRHGGSIYKNSQDKWTWTKSSGGIYGDNENGYNLGGIEFRNFGYGGVGKLVDNNDWYANSSGNLNVGIMNMNLKAFSAAEFGVSNNSTIASFDYNIRDGVLKTFKSEKNDESRIGTYKEGERTIFGGYEGVKESRGNIGYAAKYFIGIDYSNTFSNPAGQNRYSSNKSTNSEVNVSVLVFNNKFHNLTSTGVNIDIGAELGVGGAIFFGGEINVEAGKSVRWEW